MPGSGKGKKKGNRTARKRQTNKKESHLIIADDDELYGQVVDRLGSGGGTPQVRVKCSDNTTRICSLRGKMLRRIWVNKGDIVLIKLNTDRDEKFGNVIHKYDAREGGILKSMKEIEFTGVKYEDDSEDPDDIVLDDNDTEDKFQNWGKNIVVNDYSLDGIDDTDTDDDTDQPVRKTDELGNWIEDSESNSETQETPEQETPKTPEQETPESETQEQDKKIKTKFRHSNARPKRGPKNKKRNLR